MSLLPEPQTSGPLAPSKFARTSLRNKVMFKSTKGYLGIAHHIITLGGVLAVIVGCEFPIILRPNGGILWKKYLFISPLS